MKGFLNCNLHHEFLFLQINADTAQILSGVFWVQIGQVQLQNW
jgi:hypothetical protein